MDVGGIHVSLRYLCYLPIDFHQRHRLAADIPVNFSQS
jgi:hypothetical protein